MSFVLVGICEGFSRSFMAAYKKTGQERLKGFAQYWFERCLHYRIKVSIASGVSPESYGEVMLQLNEIARRK